MDWLTTGDRMKIKTHTFNGKKFNIFIGELDGSISIKNGATNEILISCDLSKKIGLETAIHEALHACKWDSNETKVDKTASDIARFLWRLGFREVK